MLKFPKLHSGLTIVDAQWEKFVRKVQKYVEHHPVTNAQGSPMARGDIVRATTGVRQAVLAIATSEANADWTGVMAEPTADQASGVMQTSNVALVRFENGIVGLTEGPCYLSASDAGAASNAIPANPNYEIRVGIIVDSSPYVTGTNPFAWVLIGKCCAPVQVQE